MPREQFLKLVESVPIINDRFTDLNRIGPQGGNGFFSMIFTSIDNTTGKKVALKFYDPHHNTDPDRIKRFEREAEMLLKLKAEPYVIDFVDGPSILIKDLIDPLNGLHFPVEFKFFAMELADHSVEYLLCKMDPDPMTSLLCFKEMIKGVLRIHRRNICHRDLKPSNFLISGKRILLSDLGTAKCMDLSMPQISVSYNAPVGDLHYVSPEALVSIGIADEYVFLSDIFSMGAILFEMFAKTVLTTQIYTKAFFAKMIYMDQILSRLPPSKKNEPFKHMIEDLAKSFPLPDIYSFNDYVPKCIKNQLNLLYKRLASIDFKNRVFNPTSIHRQLDICILTLRNEHKYLEWLNRKRQRALTLN
ncbi:MAG: serine/threonine-protein kinase [Desulfobaccales bacterium]